MNTNRKSLYANNLCGCVLTFFFWFFHLYLDSVLGNVNDSHFLVVLDSNYVGALKLQQAKKRKQHKTKKSGCSCLCGFCSIVHLKTFDDRRRGVYSFDGKHQNLERKSWNELLLIRLNSRHSMKITFAINQLNVETVQHMYIAILLFAHTYFVSEWKWWTFVFNAIFSVMRKL